MCMLVQGANNKENNDRDLCVTLWYKKMFGVYNSNGFEVYNLWYAYVVMKCFTTKTKQKHIYI